MTLEHILEYILQLLFVSYIMFPSAKLRTSSPMAWKCDGYIPFRHYWAIPDPYPLDQRARPMDRLSLRLINESLLNDAIKNLGRRPVSAIYKIITTHNTQLYREVVDECYSGSLCQYMYRHGLGYLTTTDTDLTTGYIMRCVHGSHSAEGVSVHNVQKYLQRHDIMAVCDPNDVITFVRNQCNRFTITGSHNIPRSDWLVGYVPHDGNHNVVDLIVEVFRLIPGDQVAMWAVLSLCRCHPNLFHVNPLMMSHVLQWISMNDRLVVKDGLCRLTTQLGVPASCVTGRSTIDKNT